MNNSKASQWSKIILSLNLRMRSPETFLFQQQSLVQETVFVPELSFVYFPFSAVFSNFHISVRPRCYYFMPHKSARMNAHSFFQSNMWIFSIFASIGQNILMILLWMLCGHCPNWKWNWAYSGNTMEIASLNRNNTSVQE